MPLTERQEHFIITMGACLESARLGHLRIEIELPDGTHVVGVPHFSPSDPWQEQIDATGVDASLELGGSVVQLEGVRSYRVMRPA